MSAIATQHAAGLVGRQIDRTPRAGEITPQPVVVTRLDGEQLRFCSVADFHSWLDGERRRKTLVEEVVCRA